MVRAALAAVLLSPLLAAAGVVPVCGGTESTFPQSYDGGITNVYIIACSEAFTWVDESTLGGGASWFSTLSIADAGSLVGPALLLWSVAWVIRLIMNAIGDTAL